MPCYIATTDDEYEYHIVARDLMHALEQLVDCDLADVKSIDIYEMSDDDAMRVRIAPDDGPEHTATNLFDAPTGVYASDY